MTSKRSQTPNRGAADERQTILRKIKRMISEEDAVSIAGHARIDALEILLNWIEARDVRASKKEGGLGRKRAKKD